MKLYANPTSPYVRVVRMGMAEKGLGDAAAVQMVDAWADGPDLLRVNGAGRVPALVLDDGTALTESALILRWLDQTKPEPALCPPGPAGAAVLARAGIATGVIDAAVAILIGRKSAAGFDGDLVGTKRFRTMRDGLARLDAALPGGAADKPTLDLADITGITAFDYAVFRFTGEDWAGRAPRLAAFCREVAGRPSVKDTAPRA